MPRDERLELGDELGVDARARGRRRSVPRARRGGDPRAGGSPPARTSSSSESASAGPRQSASASRRSSAHARRLAVARLAHELLEAAEVELASRRARAGSPRPRVQEPGSEQLAKLRDRVLKRRRRRSRRVLAPELIDETLGRDRLVRPQEQQRQQRALVSAAERHGRALVEHLERTEDPELEHVRGCNRVHESFERPRASRISGPLGPRE